MTLFCHVVSNITEYDFFYGFVTLFCDIVSDINECEINNGGCEHLCYNEIGGYRCGCDEGYHCGRDKHECMGRYLNVLYYDINSQSASHDN